jgi:hypothetical protein
LELDEGKVRACSPVPTPAFPQTLALSIGSRGDERRRGKKTELDEGKGMRAITVTAQ